MPIAKLPSISCTYMRRGQEDTGDEQVLLVWAAAGKSIDEITSELQEISEPIPYE